MNILKISAIGLLILLTMAAGPVSAQQSDTAGGKPAHLSGRLFSRIRRQTAALNTRLAGQTAGYLQEMSQREDRLEKQCASTDPAGARQLFAGSSENYKALAGRIKTDSGRQGQGFSGAYPAYLDSLQGSVAFVKQNPQLLSGGAGELGKVQGAASQLQALQARLNDADAAKAYIRQRQQLIGQYLSAHGMTSGPAAGVYAGMKRDVYYYGQQLRVYKEMWSNPDKLEQGVLGVLNRFPAFQNFMKNNSLLGGVFRLPGGYGTPQAISGLQTKAQVAAIVQGKLGTAAGAGGGLPGGHPEAGGGADVLQTNLQSAETQLNGYKSRLSALGAGNGDLDMPDFVPNDQKTHTFWKRLEYGVDIQTSRTNYYFPNVTDFGFSLGYKLGHNNVVGVGASYKLGWGNGIQHIAFSSQGVGLRSFLQVRIKGSFSASGGFEYNYTTPFASYQQLKQLQYWTKSGLVGVTKTVSMKNRVFKKTSVSLLWDFLSYQQVPKTQPFLFRIGYNF
jgi:hypothetical protein